MSCTRLPADHRVTGSQFEDHLEFGWSNDRKIGRAITMTIDGRQYIA